MPILPTAVLPKRIPHGPQKPTVQVSPLLLDAAGSELEEVLQKLHTSKGGLSAAEAERRLQEYGPNVVAREERHPRIHLLGKALINPLVILLLVLAASSILTRDFRASFDKGMSQFTWLMIYFILVMVPLVFIINGLTKGDWKEAFFFALAVAVGLTPAMLPMIVAVCLTKGALAMSRKKVIVKRLNSI